MVEGLSKGAGLALLAIPMAPAFTFNEAVYKRLVVKYFGLSGGVNAPWTHHCVNGDVRVLNEASLNHLESCRMLGRNSAPHNAVRDTLKHLVEQCGITDAAVTETPVQASDGAPTNADVVYIDKNSGQRVILEVSIVTVGSDSSLWAGARDGFDAVKNRLLAKEMQKRSHPIIRRILDEAGNNTIFTPIVMSSSGAMGASMIAFLREVYERTKATGKFVMAEGQPKMRHTWNTDVAPTYWDMRLSVACAATDALFQNRVIQRDVTRNLPVVARQPHWDPNYTVHAAAQAPCAVHAYAA